jgi:hypothetical protein
MSMQLAVGVVGGIVGSFFGMPQLGFVIGSLIGGALAPKTHNFGPRLDDQKVTVSTYGAGIPTIYGTMRVNGNVVWSTIKLEEPFTQSTGKGGGSSNTSYRYFVHMAVALCYGPISGIRKVWKDGKLIYDASTGVSLNSALASATNFTNLFNTATIYLGDEAQLPDPVMESFDGVGNVPAYRGMAYVMFTALECPGGRVPQFSFEVTVNAGQAPVAIYGSPFDTTGNNRVSYSQAPTSSDPVTIFAENGVNTGGTAYQKTVDIYQLTAGSLIKTGTLTPGDTAYNYTGLYGSADIDGLCYRRFTASTYVDTGTNVVLMPDGTQQVFTVSAEAFGQSTSRWSKQGNRFVISGDHSRSSDVVQLFDWNTGAALGTDSSCWATGLWIGTGYVWVLANISGTLTMQARHRDTLAILASAALPSGISGATWSSCQASGSQLSAMTVLGSVVSLWTIAVSGSTLTFTLSNTGSVGTAPIVVAGQAIGAGPGLVNCISNIGTGSTRLCSVMFNQLAPNPPSVASIITDQCTKAGLTSGQIDVSTLVDTVWGYTITNPASVRDNLRPLMTAFAIDATEENGTVKFFKRSAISSMATVPFTDLAAVEGSGTPGDPMPLTHAQQADLFRSVAISYLNPAFDYQTGTETARRTLTTSVNDQTLDLPIATDANTVQSVAQMALYDNWNDRNQRSAAVSRKYAYLSPGDGVTIEYPQGTFQMWRLVKVTDTGKLLQWEVVPADSSIYTQLSIAGGTAASAANSGQQVAALPPRTNMQIVDGPILQDADNNAGPYVALSGVAAGFPGAELFTGNDVTSLLSRGTVQNEAIVGFAETALAAPPVGNTVDETNLVTVNVGRFTLNSCTRDSMLSNGTNIAAIGDDGRWEFFQFYNAASLGGGRYILSGLNRGRRGTEWAAGMHQTGEKFVMLGLAGTLRPATSVGEIGLTKTYEAITAGRESSSATIQTYANTGEGLKPFSPVNARWSVDASNNITITWDRRTRLSENWLLGLVPLGETSEAYSVDFYTSSAFTTVAGTLTSTTDSLTISAAQQTAFGLTPGATPFVNIYQVSSSIGRGHALQSAF